MTTGFERVEYFQEKCRSMPRYSFRILHGVCCLLAGYRSAVMSIVWNTTRMTDVCFWVKMPTSHNL